MIFFPDRFRVGGVRFPTNSINLKAWEYGMIAYLMKISNSKYSFFSRLTKFRQFMFKRTHCILTSSDGPTKFHTVEVCMSGYIVQYSIMKM